MTRPRIGIAFGLALGLSAAPALAQQPARPKATAPAPQPAAVQPKAAQAKTGGNERPEVPMPAMTAEMEKVLLAWEAKSREMKSLDASFERLDDFRKTTGELTIYQGRAILQAPNLAFLDFREVVDKKPQDITERIVCTGTKVVQYVAAQKQVTVWPLAKDEKNKAMEEGPLPFLFNMNAAEVKKRYALRLVTRDVQAGAKDPRPNHYLIEITPKLPIDQDAFLTASILLDKTTFLPSDIKLFLPNRKDTQWYSFKANIVANPSIPLKTFDFVVPKGWTLVENPGVGAPPKPAAGPVPKQVGAKPGSRSIMRPR